MKSQKSKKMGFMAMKLDISKTYDRVEQKFLIKIIEKMAFVKNGCLLFLSALARFPVQYW